MSYSGTQIGSDGIRRRVNRDTSDEQEVTEFLDLLASGALGVERSDDVEVQDVEPETEPSEPTEPEPEPEQELESENESEPEPEAKSYPIHVGGPMYELKSGRRVRGKVNALEAQIEEDEQDA